MVEGGSAQAGSTTSDMMIPQPLAAMEQQVAVVVDQEDVLLAVAEEEPGDLAHPVN